MRLRDQISLKPWTEGINQIPGIEGIATSNLNLSSSQRHYETDKLTATFLHTDQMQHELYTLGSLQKKGIFSGRHRESSTDLYAPGAVGPNGSIQKI